MSFINLITLGLLIFKKLQFKKSALHSEYTFKFKIRKNVRAANSYVQFI